MKTTLLLVTLLLASCASNPEANAIAREAMLIAISEYQRQHPVLDEK